MKTFLATLPMDHPDKIEARRRVEAQIANGLRSKDDLAEWDAMNEWGSTLVSEVNEWGATDAKREAGGDTIVLPPVKRGRK